jgi:MarR-like DNA-binding transcriptional regulator SgrR of sgrS sRNA
VRRRALLKAAAAATVSITAAPRLARADRAKTLIFVGVADLSVLDPVITGARPTLNYAYLVFDTLYGIDTAWKAQPQMVEGHSVEEDGLTWTLKLRDGMRFHDKEPVLARDVSPASDASRRASMCQCAQVLCGRNGEATTASTPCQLLLYRGRNLSGYAVMSGKRNRDVVH